MKLSSFILIGCNFEVLRINFHFSALAILQSESSLRCLIFFIVSTGFMMVMLRIAQSQSPDYFIRSIFPFVLACSSFETLSNDQGIDMFRGQGLIASSSKLDAVLVDDL